MADVQRALFGKWSDLEEQDRQLRIGLLAWFIGGIAGLFAAEQHVSAWWAVVFITMLISRSMLRYFIGKKKKEETVSTPDHHHG